MAHAHDHQHDHSHGAQSYFTEQLCTIGIGAAYAGAMGVMVFSALVARSSDDGERERSVLSIIAPWIQIMVLVGGLILLALVILRAVAVWLAAKKAGQHDHQNGHDHEHADHDHGWSPIRYIPLVLPLVMFFLGLPNDRMIKAVDSDIMNRGSAGTQGLVGGADPADITGSFGIAALGDFGMSGVGGWQYALGTAITYAEEESILPVDAVADLDQLEQASQSHSQREHWRSLRRVEIEGMFNRVATNDQGYTIFRVVRLRMACCINDARPAFVVGMNRKPLQNFTESGWIAVQGKVEFANVNGKWTPFIRAFQVKKTKPPGNPYLK